MHLGYTESACSSTALNDETGDSFEYANEPVCKRCGAPLQDHPGYVIWCETCNWNINPLWDDECKSKLEKATEKIGEKLKDLLQSDLTPHKFTPSKVCAYIFASFIYMIGMLCFLSVPVIGIKVYIFVSKFEHTEIKVATALFFIILTLVMSVRILYSVRPPNYNSIKREDFPTLFHIIDQLTESLGADRIDDVIFTDEYNAYITEIGFKKRKVLGIGLPLFYLLADGEKIALLSHEIAHSLHQDTNRGSYLGNALNLLGKWYTMIQPVYSLSCNEASLLELSAILMIIVNVFRYILAQIILVLWYVFSFLVNRDSQRAEYYADYLATKVSGTDAMMVLLGKLHFSHTFDITLKKLAKYRYSTDLFDELKVAFENLPSYELERIKRLMTMSSSRVDSTHPPTLFRMELLKNKPQPGTLFLDRRTSAALEKELNEVKEDYEKILFRRYKEYGEVH